MEIQMPKEEKEQLKKQFGKLLQAFFQEEHGNRITTNNMEGLLSKLYRTIDAFPEKAGKGKE